jgi:hypothetical protein
LKSVRIWRYVVSVLVVVSLLVNFILTLTLLEIRQGFRSAVTAARDSLTLARTEPIELTVSVREEVPINTMVPIDETFTVPLRFNFSLSTQVTTYVNIPLLGRQEIVVPVEATIPVSETLEIPFLMTIPVNITPTLELDVPVQVLLPVELIDALEALINEYEEGLLLRSR